MTQPASQLNEALLHIVSVFNNRELSDPPMQWFKQRYHHIITGGA